MPNLFRRAVLTAAILATAFVSPHAAMAQSPTVLATYPAPTFIENLDIAPDGAIYVTNYTGRGIEVIRPGAGSTRFATLAVHPVSILALTDGFLVAAHGTPFTAGPSFIGSGRLLRLDAAGAVRSDQPVPDVGMLNGMTRLDDRSVLIADSVKGQVLRYELSSGALSTWLADARLAPQTTPNFRPGANGVKLRGREVLISSSAARKLFRVAMGADGRPAGDLAVLHDLPGADDFALLSDGGIVMTTHGDRVVRVAANGQTTVLPADPRVLGNTAVAVIGTGKDRRAIILGTGGFSEGGKADAAVVSVPLPE